MNITYILDLLYRIKKYMIILLVVKSAYNGFSKKTANSRVQAVNINK